MQARELSLRPKTVMKLMTLKNEAEAEGEYRVARRIHAVLLNHDGFTSGQIVSLLKSPRSRVSEWLRNYERYGYEGLLEGYRSGRQAELDRRQQQTLADLIDSGPVAYGFVSGVWTSPMITRIIEEEFGVRYHPGHVRRLLHHLGFSVQRPRRKLAKADPVKQDRWHRYTYPNLKKRPTPAGRR